MIIVATDQNFDEQGYLRANPDVAKAVSMGQQSSGRAHFETFGRKEGRLLNLRTDAPQPHYVEEYQGKVALLAANHPLDEAMSLAVGGDYDHVGNIEADLLAECGLRDEHFLIDIGCGSGRLASALKSRQAGINYLGTDIVPELLAYAKTKAPKHFRFQLHTELSIPTANATADFVTFFSVFTHLYHEESFVYLRDAARALKPDGAIVFSFLEAANPGHWSIFANTVQQRLEKTNIELTMFIERPMIEAWARHLKLSVDRYEFTAPLGQSVALLRHLS